MMQRALFGAMGAGFILNIRHGVRAGHYALSVLAALLLLALIVANLGSTVLMCGFEACPDDPVRYRLL